MVIRRISTGLNTKSGDTIHAFTAVGLFRNDDQKQTDWRTPESFSSWVDKDDYATEKRISKGGEISELESQQQQTDKSGDDNSSSIPPALRSLQARLDDVYAYSGTMNVSSQPWLLALAGVNFAIGGIDTFTAAMNTQLWRAIGQSDHSALKAVALAFAEGLVITVLAIVVQPRQLFVHVPRIWRCRHEVKWWYYIGGVLGGGFIAISVLVGSKSGFGVFFTTVIVGQTATSFVVEQHGLLGIAQRDLTQRKVVGLLIIVVGQLFIQDYTQGIPPGDEAVFLFAGLGAGAAQILSGNVSLQLAKIYDSYLCSLLVYTMIATITVTAMASFTFIAEPIVTTPKFLTWWAFVGGPLGQLVVGSAIILPLLIGNSTFTVTQIAGQLIGSAIMLFTNFLNAGRDYNIRWLFIPGVIMASLVRASSAWKSQAW